MVPPFALLYLFSSIGLVNAFNASPLLFSPKRISRTTHDMTTNDESTSRIHLQRRTILTQIATVAAATCLPTTSASASTPSASTPSEYPPVTQKVVFSVRISRSDGTFYIRDDDMNNTDECPFSADLVFGLFGTAAPNHVSQFLKYVNVTEQDLLSDNPFPSYSRSSFTELDPLTGLLQGGNIPSFEVSTIGGSDALRYGERIFPAKLWIEKEINPLDPRISHEMGAGLLTHKLLDVSPKFGITTRPCKELDSTHFVFGKLLEDECDVPGFLKKVEQIKTYSISGKPMDSTAEPAERAVGNIAAGVFNSQRDFFRGAAKSLGDTRLDKVYEGKLLRRAEVTRVTLL